MNDKKTVTGIEAFLGGHTRRVCQSGKTRNRRNRRNKEVIFDRRRLQSTVTGALGQPVTPVTDNEYDFQNPPILVTRFTQSPPDIIIINDYNEKSK
jgi:hypothetical protein